MLSAPSATAWAMGVLHGHMLLPHGVEVPQHAELTQDHGSRRVAVEHVDPAVPELEDVAAWGVHPGGRTLRLSCGSFCLSMSNA